MKAFLMIVLILLLVAFALPLGMGEMGDCPMCTSPQTLLLGVCAALVTVFLLALSNLMRNLALDDPHHRLRALSRAIYRPPRFA